MMETSGLRDARAEIESPLRSPILLVELLKTLQRRERVFANEIAPQRVVKPHVSQSAFVPPAVADTEGRAGFRQRAVRFGRAPRPSCAGQTRPVEAYTRDKAGHRAETRVEAGRR